MIVSNLGKRIMRGKEVCLIENMNDMIVVNDGHKGITVYDENLKTIYSMEIMHGLMIEACYKNTDTREFLLFCRENNRFIHIDLLKQMHRIIKIPAVYQGVIYSMCYHWRKDKVYIGDYSEQFFCVDISRAVIEQISKKDMKSIDKGFYRDYLRYQKAIRYDYQKNITYADFSKRVLGYTDMNQNYIVERINSPIKYNLGRINETAEVPSWKQIHFIEIIGDLLVLVSEECVYLFHKRVCRKLSISQYMSFSYAVGTLHGDMYCLFILACSKRISSDSDDIIYKLGVSI